MHVMIRRPVQYGSETLERRLKATKFHNSVLERIASEAYQSKVCGSMEEAYGCLIPAFSQARVLPEVGEAMSPQVTQIFRALVGKGHWLGKVTGSRPVICITGLGILWAASSLITVMRIYMPLPYSQISFGSSDMEQTPAAMRDF